MNPNSFAASSINIIQQASSSLDILSTGRGHRASADQSNFRSELITSSNATKTDHALFLWCLIVAQYFDTDIMVASHIFADGHGQDAMDAIFGVTKQPELFSAHNGILMCKRAAKYFDQGLFVLVPDVPDNPSPAAIQAWHKNSPKEFKIRICESNAKEESEDSEEED